jgi:hypothetical protein
MRPRVSAVRMIVGFILRRLFVLSGEDEGDIGEESAVLEMRVW